MGITGFFTGEVRLRITCRSPESIINLCAKNGVSFRELKTSPGEVRMTVTRRGEKTLRELSARLASFTVEEEARRGAPFILSAVRSRYALIAGLLITAALLTLSGFYIWQIEVIGNESVPTEEILAALRELGVRTGTLTFTVDRDGVSNGLCIRIPELCWATVNVRGSRAWVLVREARPGPEMIDYGEPADLVAAKTGTITAMTVLRGRAEFRVGDTVLPGETLISGEGARALGSVTARTGYTLTASMPVKCLEKRLTGRSVRRVTLIFGEKRIKLYFTGGNPYAFCDKIETERYALLPEGSALPLGVLTEVFYEAEAEPRELTPEEAESILAARLTGELMHKIGSGSVETRELETAVGDGVVTVTLRATCLEEITRLK